MQAFDVAKPEGADDVDINKAATRVYASALVGGTSLVSPSCLAAQAGKNDDLFTVAWVQASWRMGVIDAPSNRGLKPERWELYNRTHFYQIPENPIGTVSCVLPVVLSGTHAAESIALPALGRSWCGSTAASTMLQRGGPTILRAAQSVWGFLRR